MVTEILQNIKYFLPSRYDWIDEIIRLKKLTLIHQIIFMFLEYIED
jgi:hypothetical protein